MIKFVHIKDEWNYSCQYIYPLFSHIYIFGYDNKQRGTNIEQQRITKLVKVLVLGAYCMLNGTVPNFINKFWIIGFIINKSYYTEYSWLPKVKIW